MRHLLEIDLKTIESRHMYHYTECGLQNIWLRNGVEEIKTSYGKATSIRDVEGLHNTIGLSLVMDKPRLSGAEVRFLRTELDLLQAELAKILGVSEQSVRGWEKHRTKITKPAERLLRSLYREHVCGDGIVRELVDRIARINRDAYHKKLEFEDSDSGWRQAVA